MQLINEKELREAQTFMELTKLISRRLVSLGFGCFAYASQHGEQGFATPRHAIVCSTFPSDWYEYYMAQGFATIDPIVEHGTSIARPLFWSVEDDWTRYGPEVVDFFEELASRGFRQGVCQTLPPAKAAIGAINVLYDDADNLLGRLADALLFMAYAHHETPRIYQKEFPHHHRPPLSSREREIFSLIATGMTSQQIADQLHLAKRTVETHIDAAQSKLGAKNRTQALCEAITLKQVSHRNDYRRDSNTNFYFTSAEDLNL